MTQEHDVATLAQEIIDGLSSTFKARNGRDVSIEGDDGEKCWILGNEGYEALIALSAMPAREVTCWQPIETAPKDNTDILLGFAGQDRPPVVAGWFENAWLEYDSCNIAKGNPTHWKPLDPAPEGV